LDSLKAMTVSRPPLTSELQLTCIIIGKVRRGRKPCMPIGRQENGTGSRAPRECDRRDVISISLVDPSSATRRVPAAPIAPEFLQVHVPRRKEGAGNAGRSTHPQLRVQK
jgi:hypothetical protein